MPPLRARAASTWAHRSDDPTGAMAELTGLPSRAPTPIAPLVEDQTVRSMPRPGPPTNTRHGHLHPVGGRRSLPVGPSALPAPGGADIVGAGIGAATMAQPAFAEHCPVAPIVGRRLDSGRLAARELIGSLGWGPGAALCASVNGSQRIIVTAQPATSATEKTAGTYTVHTDAKSQLVVPESLRSWLGVEPSGTIVARVLHQPGDEVALELLNPAVINDALGALDALTALDAATARAELAAVSPLGVGLASTGAIS